MISNQAPMISPNHSGHSDPEARAILYAIDRDQCYVQGRQAPEVRPDEIIRENPELLDFLRTQSLGYDLVMLLPFTSHLSNRYVCQEFTAFKDICKDGKKNYNPSGNNKAFSDTSQDPRLTLPDSRDLLSHVLKDIYIDDYSKTLIVLGHCKLIHEALSKPENMAIKHLDYLVIDDKKEKLIALHKTLVLLKHQIPHYITIHIRHYVHGSGLGPQPIQGLDAIQGEAQYPILYENLIKKLKAEYDALSITRKFIRMENSLPNYRRPAQSIDLSLSVSTAYEIRRTFPDSNLSLNFADWIQKEYLDLEAKEDLDLIQNEINTMPYFNFFLPTCYISRKPSIVKALEKIYNKVSEGKEEPQKAIASCQKLLKSGSQTAFFRDETTRTFYELVYKQMTTEKINTANKASSTSSITDSEKEPFIKHNMS